MKPTFNEEFLEGKTIATFDFAVLLAEDNVEEDEYEMQRDFLEHYLKAPITAAFTTYAPLRLPADLAEGLSVTKVIEEDMTGRDAEVLGLLSTFVEDLRKLQLQHDAEKTKPAFQKYDKDNSGAIDREELAALSKDLG